jgi:hypothetical protein
LPVFIVPFVSPFLPLLSSDTVPDTMHSAQPHL